MKSRERGLRPVIKIKEELIQPGPGKLVLHALLLFLFLLTSCLPTSNSSSGRKSKVANSSATSDVADPDNEEDPFEDDLSFLQQGSTTTTSTLTLGLNFVDSFYLRGNEIHHYLDDRDTSVVLCFVAYLPSSTSNKLLVMAASSQNVYNFSTGGREYYLSMQSSDEDQNTGYCQNSGMSTALATLYPGANKAYLVDDVCTNCTGAFTSTALQVFDTAGNSLTDISTTHLALELDSSIDANSGSEGSVLCDDNDDCESLGYNCCSNGQCVNDGQLKQTYDSSDPLYSDYLQAITQATSVPSSFSLYPEFFYVCAVDPLPTAAPASTADVQATADALFAYKQELYNCVVPGNDELSVCTVYFPTAVATIAAGSSVFSTTADDRNFTDTYAGSSATASTLNTIQKIVFGGSTLYDRTAAPTPSGLSLGSGNDNLTSSTNATFTFTPASSVADKSLKMSFTLDGSCTSINSYLAQCTKYYVMGQNTGEVDDHVLTSQYFDLPDYADTSRSMTIYLDGARVYSGIQYTLTTNGATSNNSIMFNTNYEVQNTQTVEIQYYVSLTTYPNLIIQKTLALDAIDTMCDCGGSNDCTLAPVYEEEDDETSDIVDYECIYPTAEGSSEQPLQTTVYVNSKSVPVRYYDLNGVAKDTPKSTDDAQEGTPFAYTNSDVLRPNNMSTTIGFNEIYGSLNPANADAAQAPVKVDVVKNRTYDIFVDGGSFAQCQNCGTDYYSSLAKIFPDNFLFWAAGYAPDPTRTSRTESTGFFGGEMRSDDMLFGRACWLPATMIPWSHNEGSTSATTNRRNRMSAQHFLFANGYQRDWYGFDYGALIGSFDGVEWFAIGNQRRIKADGNKLYLAINAYFGDLTSSATNTVTINEVTSYTGSYVEYDDESDGAECRSYHFCESDQDCVTQLGWDYVCDDIGSIKTSWPTFDDNGNEIPQSTNNYKTLASIVGGTNGQNHRCVYRGRGAPCIAAFAAATPTTSFNQGESYDSRACVLSNYCAALTASTFNNSIARFGKSAASQNASAYVTPADEDTFGLAARLLGRPLYFSGSAAANTSAKTNLTAVNVSSICIPGHETTVSDTSIFQTLHSSVPDSDWEKGDRVLNIGHTLSSTSSSLKYFYMGCPAFDEDGDLYHLLSPLATATAAYDWFYQAAGQNISTKALEIFDEPALPVITPMATSAAPFTSQVLQTNRCMRAPGAACYSDFDCAPSDFITDRLAGYDTASSGNISEQELAFWQEEMICTNPGAYTFEQQDFDLKDNRCCRDVNKTLSIATYMATPVFTPHLIAPLGASHPINDTRRYSRIVGLLAKALPLFTAGATADMDYPTLAIKEHDETTTNYYDYTSTSGDVGDFYDKQWKSFDYIASNQCCTKHWIRNFDSDENGGGHTWDPAKMQNHTKTNFECINYIFDTSLAGTFTNCDDPNNQDETECSMRNMTTGEIEAYSKFFSSLELLGIPQVYVLTPHVNVSATDDQTDISCMYLVGSETVAPTEANYIIPGTLRSVTSAAENADYQKYTDLLYEDGRYYYGASIDANFHADTKKIFDDDQVSCCLPSGVAYDHDITDEMCCTGKAYDDGDTTDKRCCLPDYTNLSVYLNRYISSEANYLSDEMFSSLTGALLDASVAEQVGRAKNLCCSGNYAVGVAAGQLPIPDRVNGDYSTDAMRNRFIFSDDASDSPNNEYFDYGLRWNTDVYCAPEGYSADSTSGSGSDGSGDSTSDE